MILLMVVMPSQLYQNINKGEGIQEIKMSKTVNYKFCRKLVAEISFDILGIHMEILEHGLYSQGVWNDYRPIRTHPDCMCGPLGHNKCYS